MKTLTRALIYVLKFCFYCLFLIVAVGALLYGLEKFSEYALGKSYLGMVYHHDMDMVRKDAIQPVSHYDYDFTPGACVEFNILKGNQYEYANNAGFREPREISREKPDDEYRIFLTGGSTAFGLGAIGEAAPMTNHYSIEYRETISHVMEMILNATAPIEGKKIKVYNTAVWGHSYQHLLIRYPVKLRQYKPDLIISLDGANELPLVSKLIPEWNYFHEGQYNNIIRDIYSYSGSGLASYLTLWLKNNTFLMTYLWAGQDIFQELNVRAPVHKGVVDSALDVAQTKQPSVEDMSRMLDGNINTVIRVIEDYSSAIQNDGIPHIMALQPWLYMSKKPFSPQEKAINELPGFKHYYGVPSDRAYKLLVDKIVASAQKRNYFVADFSDYFDDVSEWVFLDWCHLTSGANFLLAKELSNLVKEHVFQRPLAPADLTHDKNSFFWDLAAASKVVYPDTEAERTSLSQNALRGYPTEAVFEFTPKGNDAKSEIILDMQKTYPFSRIRIVWGDEESTPEEWEIAYSTDMNNWQTFVKGSINEIDWYSRWPGYEYYAAEPVQARYLKYQPTKGSNSTMKLRLISAYR